MSGIGKKILGFFVELDETVQTVEQPVVPGQPTGNVATAGNSGNTAAPQAVSVQRPMEVASNPAVPMKSSKMFEAIMNRLCESLTEKAAIEFLNQKYALEETLTDVPESKLIQAALNVLVKKGITVQQISASINEALNEDIPAVKNQFTEDMKKKNSELNVKDKDIANLNLEIQNLEKEILNIQQKIANCKKTITTLQSEKEQNANVLYKKQLEFNEAVQFVSNEFTNIKSNLK